MSHNYRSSLGINELAAWLMGRSASKDRPLVVLSHAKPDGDAIGSMLGLVTALNHIGQPAVGRLLGPVPAPLHVWASHPDLAIIQGAGDLPVSPAAVVLVDTGSWSQVDARTGWVQPWLQNWLTETAIIDHHTSGDIPAAHRWIESNTAACSEMVMRLADALGCPLGDPSETHHILRPAREALFLGMATDTGWFRFSNTSAQTHELCAKLIRCGVSGSDLYICTEHQDRPERLRLLSYAYSHAEWFQDTRCVLVSLPLSAYRETGTSYSESEGLLDAFREVKGNKVAIQLSEHETASGDVHVRMSMRSNPGAGAIDVAEIARRFNGGGHARAAGARPEGNLESVTHQMRALLKTL